MGSGASFWVLIISYLWKNLGYTVVLWTAALGGIPASVYEAAQMDGANSGGWTMRKRPVEPDMLLLECYETFGPQAASSMRGTRTPEEAVNQALQSLNLYLSE